jgi:hypothetical protein
LQIQLFVSAIIDEIRFDPDDIIEVDDELANKLIQYEAAQDIKCGILSIEEIKRKTPNFVELESVIKLTGDFDLSSLTETGE